MSFDREASRENSPEQLSHASARVNSNVYGHIWPGSRVKACKATEQTLCGNHDAAAATGEVPAAASLAVLFTAKGFNTPQTKKFVGPPGLDPGTSGALLVGAGR